MAKKKCLGESRMGKLWRQAVLIKCSHRCQICGKVGDENLEAHHIIRRMKKVTRWNYKNGCALCHRCHMDLHNQNKIKREVESAWPYIDELDELNLLTYKPYLIKEGLTHESYYNRLADEMKFIIAENTF